MPRALTRFVPKDLVESEICDPTIHLAAWMGETVWIASRQGRREPVMPRVSRKAGSKM